MIEVKTSLPEGALLGPEQHHLKTHLEAAKAVWFCGPDARIHTKTEGETTWVTGWDSSTGAITALPSRANKSGGRFDADAPIPAITLKAGQHCGYSANGIAKSAERFTVAVIYRSEQRDGRTLFSVAGEDKSNMLFANENKGILSVVDRSNTLQVICDAPKVDNDRHALLVASYETGKLRVALNGETVGEARGEVPGLGGTAELFIGCRNHRSGILKTVGAGRISDLFYWPERTLIGPASVPIDPSLTLLYDFWRWNR